MRVFISSLIRDLEPLRDATAKAIVALAHDPVRLEDFGASSSSPQVDCLAGVRDADVVVLILGAEYGSRQGSGLSATHEEYREARESRPVLAFVKDNITPVGEQAGFIREVREWEQGHYTASFRDADDLYDKVIRGLHSHLLADASSPVNESELIEQARALVPDGTLGSTTMLVLAVTGGPSRQVLRPAELEREDLRRFLESEALTGADPVLDLSFGTALSIRGDTVVLEQRDNGNRVALSETGSIVIVQPAMKADARQVSIPSIIEEDVVERLARAIRFAGRVLNHVDQQQRISHVAVMAALLNAGWIPWRTRQEHARNPNSAPMNLHGSARLEATLSPSTRRRAALMHETQQLAEDLAVRLRREAKTGP